jgi:SAM-dependent methyltransferase
MTPGNAREIVVDAFGRVDEHPDAPMIAGLIAELCGQARHTDRNRALLPLLRLRHGERVLEVGCGTGVLLRELQRLTGGRVRLTGVDPSALALDRARRELGEAVELRQMDGRALEFPDGSFDAVCCSRVLNHAAEPARIVAEIGRVVRPGGRVLCIESAASFAAGVDDELRVRTTGFTSPRIGRDLVGLLRRGGLGDVVAVPDARVTIDQPDVAALRAEFRAGRGTRALAVRDGWCAAEEVERYFDQLGRSVELGSYLECELHLAVLGKKPRRADPA